MTSDELSFYGETSINTLLKHYGSEKSAETLQDETTVGDAVIFPDIRTEWKKFHRFMAKQPKSGMKSQLKKLRLTEMLKPMFHNLNTFAAIVLSIPASTGSVARSFSQMKLIKTRLCRCLCDSSLSRLMKMDIESPDSFIDGNVKDIVDEWNRRAEEYPPRLTPF